MAELTVSQFGADSFGSKKPWGFFLKIPAGRGTFEGRACPIAVAQWTRPVAAAPAVVYEKDATSTTQQCSNASLDSDAACSQITVSICYHSDYMDDELGTKNL